MDAYSSEAQQVEEIKKWWRENGLSVVLGLTLGISGIFGWRYWQGAKVEQAESASLLYSDMIASMQDEDGTETTELANTILADYEDTAYGVFARLALAGLAVAADDLDAAEAQLRQALRQSGDDSLSHVIRIRLVRVLISRNKLDEAASLVERQEQGAFASSYGELMGDISALRGDIEAARDSYRQSVNNGRAEGRDVSIIELKLDNIGQL